MALGHAASQSGKLIIVALKTQTVEALVSDERQQMVDTTLLAFALAMPEREVGPACGGADFLVPR